MEHCLLQSISFGKLYFFLLLEEHRELQISYQTFIWYKYIFIDYRLYSNTTKLKGEISEYKIEDFHFLSREALHSFASNDFNVKGVSIFKKKYLGRK